MRLATYVPRLCGSYQAPPSGPLPAAAGEGAVRVAANRVLVAGVRAQRALVHVGAGRVRAGGLFFFLFAFFTLCS